MEIFDCLSYTIGIITNFHLVNDFVVAQNHRVVNCASHILQVNFHGLAVAALHTDKNVVLALEIVKHFCDLWVRNTFQNADLCANLLYADDFLGKVVDALGCFGRLQSFIQRLVLIVS